jgi:hypothetical protein
VTGDIPPGPAYLVPPTKEYVEAVAKAIAKNVMRTHASNDLEQMTGLTIDGSSTLEESFDNVFESLWTGSEPNDLQQRQRYMNDALVAINTINLKLLTDTGKA